MVKWLALMFFALTPPAVAQSRAEPGRDRGLQGPARRRRQGDAAEIERLVEAGAALEARDANGRTPLHVAAFARSPRRRARW